MDYTSRSELHLLSVQMLRIHHPRYFRLEADDASVRLSGDLKAFYWMNLLDFTQCVFLYSRWVKDVSPDTRRRYETIVDLLSASSLVSHVESWSKVELPAEKARLPRLLLRYLNTDISFRYPYWHLIPPSEGHYLRVSLSKRTVNVIYFENQFLEEDPDVYYKEATVLALPWL